MPAESPSIFSRIVAREIPADIVFENERLIAFSDIAPQAAVHLLVVPKTDRFADVVELAADDPALLAELVSTARELAGRFSNGEFRLTFNTGASSGQTVFHVHAHVLSDHSSTRTSTTSSSTTSAAPGGTPTEGSLGNE